MTLFDHFLAVLHFFGQKFHIYKGAKIISLIWFPKNLSIIYQWWSIKYVSALWLTEIFTFFFFFKFLTTFSRFWHLPFLSFCTNWVTCYKQWWILREGEYPLNESKHEQAALFTEFWVLWTKKNSPFRKIFNPPPPPSKKKLGRLFELVIIRKIYNFKTFWIPDPPTPPPPYK